MVTANSTSNSLLMIQAKKTIPIIVYGAVAQLVERYAENVSVPRSIRGCTTGVGCEYTSIMYGTLKNGAVTKMVKVVD